MSLTPALLPGGPHCEDFLPAYGVRYTDVNADHASRSPPQALLWNVILLFGSKIAFLVRLQL